jgi:hypothetical protein
MSNAIHIGRNATKLLRRGDEYMACGGCGRLITHEPNFTAFSVRQCDNA